LLKVRDARSGLIAAFDLPTFVESSFLGYGVNSRRIFDLASRISSAPGSKPSQFEIAALMEDVFIIIN
jgi:hypothetical protein